MITNNARRARRAFLTAGVYGRPVALPLTFLEGRRSQDVPPAIPPEVLLRLWRTR